MHSNFRLVRHYDFVVRVNLELAVHSAGQKFRNFVVGALTSPNFFEVPSNQIVASRSNDVGLSVVVVVKSSGLKLDLIDLVSREVSR